MNWINSNLLYIIWVLSIIIFIALYFLLRALNPSMRRSAIVALSFVAIIILVFRIVFFSVRGYMNGGSALAWRQFAFGLPGHLCGISSIIIPIAVVTRKKFLMDYTYFISLPASLFAIILNTSVGVNSFAGDLDTYIFWIPHLMYAVIPVYLIIFEGLRPSLKTIPKVLIVLAIVYTIDHAINKIATYAFNDYVVNYLYTMGPGDFINNVGDGLSEKKFHAIGFIEIIWNIFPVEYFYMFIFFPLAVVISLVMGFPFWIVNKRDKSKQC